MEPFDLPVGLEPVGAGPFVGDARVNARMDPGLGAIAGTVVGQDALDGDALGGKGGDGALPEPGSGVASFVVQDLGVDHSGAVVQGGVEVAVADAAVTTSAVLGAPAVHAPPAAVTDAGELLDVHVGQLTRSFPLVALRSPRSSRPSPAPRRSDWTVDAAIPTSRAMRSAPHRWRLRRRITRRRPARGVRFGERRGRLERSKSPPPPSASIRSRHFRTVLGSTWNRSAVASTVQPRSRTQATIRRRPSGVNTAFGCWDLA